MVAFSPIESKKATMMVGIANNATLYASVQSGPIRSGVLDHEKSGALFLSQFSVPTHSRIIATFKNSYRLEE